jgi:hypothetical protein
MKDEKGTGRRVPLIQFFGASFDTFFLSFVRLAHDYRLNTLVRERNVAVVGHERGRKNAGRKETRTGGGGGDNEKVQSLAGTCGHTHYEI